MNAFREIFRGTNGDLSSKRIIGAAMILAGIIFGAVCLSIPPFGTIDSTVLVFTGSLFTGGLGLLGVCVTEKKHDPNYHPDKCEEDERIK